MTESYVDRCGTCGDLITRCDRYGNIGSVWRHADADQWPYDHGAAPAALCYGMTQRTADTFSVCSLDAYHQPPHHDRTTGHQWRSEDAIAPR